jgi:hypothetical protein
MTARWFWERNLRDVCFADLFLNPMWGCLLTAIQCGYCSSSKLSNADVPVTAVTYSRTDSFDLDMGFSTIVPSEVDVQNSVAQDFPTGKREF